MAHSCITQSLDDFFQGKNPKFRILYDQFLKLVEEICGNVIVNVNKTRISFQIRTRFISFNSISESGIKVHFVTTNKLDSSRFFKVEKVGNWYVHNFLLRDAKDLDKEVEAWIKEACKYGRQEK